MSAFPHDPSYGQAELDARDWQKEADIADEEHRHGLSLQQWQDRQAELRGDQQRENDQ